MRKVLKIVVLVIIVAMALSTVTWGAEVTYRVMRKERNNISIYRVDELNQETLVTDVETPEILGMIQNFIDSEERHTDFVIREGRVWAIYGDAQFIVFDPDPPGAQTRQPIGDIEEETDTSNYALYIALGVGAITVVVVSICFICKAKKKK